MGFLNFYCNVVISGIFGIILVLLGSLMLWRKLWEQQHDPPCARGFMMAFSTLVLLSGCSCFLLEKDWFRRISPVNKIPM